MAKNPGNNFDRILTDYFWRVAAPPPTSSVVAFKP